MSPTEREAHALQYAADLAERRAARILERIGDAHVALDREFRIVGVNPAAERLLERPRWELLGRSHWELLPASTSNDAGRAYRRVVAEGVEQHLTQHYAAEGYDVHVEVDAYPTEEGGVAIFMRDITARKVAEAERERLHEALALERARLAEVFREAPVAVAVVRGRVAADLVYELVNPRYAEAVTGGRETVGRRVVDVLPELEEAHVAILQRVLDTGEPYVAVDYPVPLDRDGDGVLEEYYFNFVYHPLVECQERVDGLIAVGTEVTDSVRARREAERARERADRLQALTAALAGARTVEDVAGVIVAEAVAATGAATGMLAVRPPGVEDAVLVRQAGLHPGVIGRSGRISASHPGPAAECLRTGEPQWAESREQLDARYPAIRDIWDQLGTQALATVPLTVAGEVVGAMSYTFTAPRRLEPEDRAFFLALGRQAAQAVERARLFAAERVARADAEAASKAKGEFLTVMSHELRTPLNAIGGYAELIEMGIHGPVTMPQRQALERIQKSQRHLLGLINEVLNYARLETGTVTYTLTDVVVADAVGAAEVLVVPQLRAKGLAYAWGGGTPGLAVRADCDKLQQILLNLLSNAVKFTNAGDGLPGRVEVTAVEAPESAAVQIRVRDTGVGIPADKLDAVFEPFVQVDARLTRPHEGTGLGLAISRDLARGMSGDLTVETEIGVGSTFTITLPRAG